MNIRRYQHSDFEAVLSWVPKNTEKFTREMLPPTTYVAEARGKPIVMLSLMATNCNRAYLEYALGDPEAKGPARKQAFAGLVQYVEDLARGLGYKYLMCLAPNESLGAYYTTLGYQVNMPDLALMLKELK